MRKPQFVDLVLMAMRGRGVMSLGEIYAAVEPLFRRLSRVKRASWKGQVRETLQAFCPTCRNYERRGTANYFVHHGRGLWSCGRPAARRS